MNFPILLDANGLPREILKDAVDVIIKDQALTDTNGFETLDMKFMSTDDRAKLIDNEDIVEVNGREYVVRLVNNDKADENLINISCDATWYDINDSDPITDLDIKNSGPRAVIQAILVNTGWTVGEVTITTPHDFSIKEPTARLSALRQVPQIYGGELAFNTKSKTVDLKTTVGSQTSIMFAYRKNMPEVHRSTDTRNLVTRLYMTGKAGITISAVNGGLEYVEDYSYYTKAGKTPKVKAYHHSDERFTNPNYMKYWMQNKIKVISQPVVNYTVKVSILDGVIPELGDYVIVYDEDLNIRSNIRVMGRTINVLDLSESEIQLDTPVKTLADQLGGSTGMTDNTGGVTDAVQAVIADMTMFNLLFNSRGDDGFAYWVNQGFSIDNTAGVSGSSAFTVTGQSGVEKSLYQVVDVANRENYTVSAEVEVNNISKGTNGKVGFEITFEYDDGTTEVQWIDIA